MQQPQQAGGNGGPERGLGERPLQFRPLSQEEYPRRIDGQVHDGVADDPDRQTVGAEVREEEREGKIGGVHEGDRHHKLALVPPAEEEDQGPSRREAESDLDRRRAGRDGNRAGIDA